jgi:hypothetical protein
MTYTAAEMREMAEGYDGLANLERLAMRPERVKTYSVTAAMLRQAAEAMDREECANCDGHCDTCACPEE